MSQEGKFPLAKTTNKRAFAHQQSNASGGGSDVFQLKALALLFKI